jgi:putative ubiquitin-RnfH superfamily antitoxin RatB of RatAB toxin-antitoxin module
MADSGKIRVEVAFALADKQALIALDVEPGTTMFDAVLRSRIAEQFPGLIDPEKIPMGIFSKIEPNPRARVLNDGERVELYRPLVADPNDSRKERAQKAKQRKAVE